MNNNSIGYRNPPPAGQFKPGASGNPSGRPKGSQSISSRIEKIFNEKVTLPNGKTMPKFDVAMTQLINNGAKGDIRSANLSYEIYLKSQKSMLAEIFGKKFIKDGYINEKAMADYVNNRAQIPDVSHKPIKAITIKNTFFFATAEWLGVISEIDYIANLYQLTFKILCSICSEYRYWEGVEDVLDKIEIKEDKSKLIQKLELKREYKRPTDELMATAINTHIRALNAYNSYMKVNRDFYGSDNEYKVQAKRYLDTIFKDNFEQVRKQNLSPEQLQLINGYEKQSEKNYREFMSKDFEQLEPVKFDVTENMGELLAWYCKEN